MRHIIIKGRNIRAGARDFFKPSPNIWELKDIYPPSVLAQQKNPRISKEDNKLHEMMGPVEMKGLLDFGYPDLTLYLCSKAHRDEKSLGGFLERYILARLSDPSGKSSPLPDEIARLDPDVIVDGTKLGQISRQGGISHWRELWKVTAQNFAYAKPIYILSTPLIGFDAIIDASITSKKPFYLTQVKWHNDPDRQYQGYMVDPQDRKSPVRLLSKSDLPPDDGTLMDDTDRGKDNDFDKAFSYLPPEKRPTRRHAIATAEKKKI